MRVTQSLIGVRFLNLANGAKSRRNSGSHDKTFELQAASTGMRISLNARPQSILVMGNSLLKKANDLAAACQTKMLTQIRVVG